MRKLLLFTCALFGFMACTQNPIEEQSAIRTDAPETIRVGFEDDETRIQLNSAQKTVWTKDDLVSVFYRSNANQQWRYDGETGARTAELKRVDAGTSTRDIDRVVVVYPYNKDYYINPETYNVQATLPATQHHLANSYGTDGNIMISSSEYNQFSLKSVCGWLKLQLTGDGEVVKSIKFRGNDDEQVAGELYINSADATATLASDMGGTDDNNAGGNLVFDDTIITEVVLDCGEGVALDAEATAFYIALPPQTFEQGFTVEIEDTDGYVMEQSTDKTLLIERNTIKPMAAFEFINPNSPTQPTPASNEIWYTATEKADPYFDDFLTFGSDVVSNVWDSETKRGIITFDGDVTMIGEDAFNNCDKYTGITLPESVTSISKNAFYDCDGLTEFVIPDSVTTIGSYVFRSCSSLTSVTIGNSVTTIGSSAFRSCDSLTSVTIPDSVTTIGESAFYECRSLKKVYCNATIPPSFSNNAFSYNATGRRIYVYEECVEVYKSAWSDYKDSIYTNGQNCPDTTTIEYTTNDGNIVTTKNMLVISNIYENGVGTLVVVGKISQIPNNAFNACKSLTSVTIPDSVTTIGGYAFNSCSSLTDITIPDSVTSIGDRTFADCDSLTSVTIPDSVTSIGNSAFYSCSSLTSVYCKAVTPPAGGYDMFYNNASGRKIYVPMESVEAYKSAYRWSEYADAIVGYNF